jgi:hypothetical protein
MGDGSGSPALDQLQIDGTWKWFSDTGPTPSPSNSRFGILLAKLQLKYPRSYIEL